MADPQIDPLAAGVREFLLLAQNALKQIPAERAAAKTEPNTHTRYYREGLVDGAEETLHNLIGPLLPALEALVANEGAEPGCRCGRHGQSATSHEQGCPAWARWAETQKHG